MALSQPLAERQFSAIASARWAMLRNSLRTLGGKLELLSRVLTFGSYAVVGVAAGVGFGAFGYWATARSSAELIAGAFWFLTAFWQLFPLLKAGFTNEFDATTLLRFPVAYPTYYLLRLFYGALEPVGLIGLLGLVGLTIGVGFASPVAGVWCAAAALLTVVLNIVFTQLLLSWLERWLAQRRTREILGVLLFLFIMAFQMVGPLTRRYEETMKERGQRPAPIARSTVQRFLAAERVTPPGLAAVAVANAEQQHLLLATGRIGGLALYVLALAALLHIRLKAQYRGENLGEAAVPRNLGRENSLRVGWALPAVSDHVAAIFEKEFRYLTRSGPMLLSLVMPTLVLILFSLNATAFRSGKSAALSQYAFPIAIGYSILILTNTVYNTFGADHAGVQFYYMAPVRLRQVMAAKNLFHTGVMLAQAAILWMAVYWVRGKPSGWITVATLAAMPYILAVEFTAGNLLSVFVPKRMDFQMMGRQRASQLSALAAMGVHAAVIGIGFYVFLLAKMWAPAVFLLLGAVAVAAYFTVLPKVEQLAMQRRESIFDALCREKA